MYTCMECCIKSQKTSAAVVCLQPGMCCCPDDPSVHSDRTACLQGTTNGHSRLHNLQHLPVHLELVALGVAAEQLHSAAAIDLCRKAGVLQLLPDQVCRASYPSSFCTPHLTCTTPVASASDSGCHNSLPRLCNAMHCHQGLCVYFLLLKTFVRLHASSRRFDYVLRLTNWQQRQSERTVTRSGAVAGAGPGVAGGHRTGGGRPPAGGGTPSRTSAASLTRICAPPS